MYNPICIESYDDVLRAKNIRVGLSFNPQTSFEDFEDCIRKCDYVQLMTINPGGQGRPFIMESLNKIAKFKEKYPDIRLQVDGGITTETMRMAVEAGADDVVVGSQIFKSANPTQTYQDFVLQFENARTNFLNSKQSSRFANENII
jgi:ribulose-phosphate 3-epimerase